MTSPQEFSHSLFTWQQLNEFTVVTLARDLRTCSYGEKQLGYNRLMKQLGESDMPCLLFDLSQCAMLDSVTVGVLIGLTKEAIRKGGHASLGGVSPSIKKTLSRLLLLEPKHRQVRWDVYESVEHALCRSRP